jgi:hypothetical protein
MRNSFNNQRSYVPISEKLKYIPGLIGIRLTDEPKYQVIDMDDDKEIRLYDKMTLATITVAGKYETAVQEGFHRLSQYLFGENATSREMSMTAPFFEESNRNNWTISFILPEDMNPALAPTPLDHSITIAEKNPHLAAVIWFTGGIDLERSYAKSAELYGWLLTKPGLKPVGDVKIAKYDNPSTIPFFKRNELQLEVAETH